MQDNWNTDDINDQAWAKMKAMLDQEMPVAGESKRKPVFAWFWTAAIVVLGLITATILSLPPQQAAVRDQAEGSSIGPAEQSQALTEVEIATHREQKTVPTHTNPATGSLQKSTPSSADIQVTTPVSAPGKTDQENSSEKLAQENPSKIYNRQLPEKQTSSTVMAEEITGENTDSESATLSGNAAETQHPETSTEAVFSAPDGPAPAEMYIGQMASLPFPTLTLPELPWEQKQLYHPKKPLFLPLELRLGIISHEAKGLDGLFAELRSGIKLHRAEKWSLQSGLGMHYQLQPFTVSYQTSKGADDVLVESTDQNGSLSPGISNMDIPGQIASSGVQLKSTYLDLPLLLHWQYAPRWSVEAGTRLSWRLFSSWKLADPSAPALSGSGTGNFSLDRSSPNAFRFQFSSTGPSTSFALKDFYGAGTVGIAFRPTSGLRLRLQYHHSISNLLDSGVFNTTDRSIWLSAGLHF